MRKVYIKGLKNRSDDYYGLSAQYLQKGKKTVF
jgi:hypothetical protein